jgi:hypothetical protein
LMVTWPIPIFSDIWCMFLIFFNTYIVFFSSFFVVPTSRNATPGHPSSGKNQRRSCWPGPSQRGLRQGMGDGTMAPNKHLGKWRFFVFFFCWKRYEKMLEKIWKDTYS